MGITTYILQHKNGSARSQASEEKGFNATELSSPTHRESIFRQTATHRQSILRQNIRSCITVVTSCVSPQPLPEAWHSIQASSRATRSASSPATLRWRSCPTHSVTTASPRSATSTSTSFRTLFCAPRGWRGEPAGTRPGGANRRPRQQYTARTGFCRRRHAALRRGVARAGLPAALCGDGYPSSCST